MFSTPHFCSTPSSWAAIYHKQKLVIFGEYIPLVRWLPFVKWFSPITGGFAAGNEPVQFELRIAHSELRTTNSPFEIRNPAFVTASPLICYEDMFPQVARRAVRDDTDFLVNLTNDGWFGQSAEQWQHMAGAVFRAVENGVPLVRCCNNGVTCWIDAHGRVREIFRDNNGSVYGMGALTIDLPLEKHRADILQPPRRLVRVGLRRNRDHLVRRKNFPPGLIISTKPPHVSLPRRFGRRASAPVRSRAPFCRAIQSPKSSARSSPAW